MTPLLDLRSVSKSFPMRGGRRVVLDRVGFTVAEGEFLAIVGRSGSGKSTLLSLLAGMSMPDSGEFFVAGEPARGPSSDRAVVFQHYSLLPWLTVRENVRLAVDQAFPNESSKERDGRVSKMLELVHLASACRKYPHELSGGMKQRVAVARALAADPRVLLLDEPFGALDALTRATLQDELERIWQSDRKTIVMITNDIDEAIRLADRVAALRSDGTLGEPIEVGLPRPRDRVALLDDPRVRELRQRLASVLDVDTAPGRNASQPVRSPVAERTSPYLRLSNIEKAYVGKRGNQIVVTDIDLEVGPSEFVTIVGHSGCGKTTILSMVAGLTKPPAGTLECGGRPVTGPGLDRAVVFQQHSLLPWLTTAENVRLAVDQGHSEISARERGEIVAMQLRSVGLASVADLRPSSLSAGMRQRVGVARAFAVNPKLLLLDEPFGSLDSATRAELQRLLVERLASTGTAALLVTHDVDEAIRLSDRIVLMTDGPASVIGATLHVDLPRPRFDADLVGHPEYRRLRARILEFLLHTSARAQQKPLAQGGAVSIERGPITAS